MALVIDKHELAELIGPICKVSWIEAQCRAKKIPHTRIGNKYGFTHEHVAEILAMHERRPEPQQPAAAPEPAPRRKSRAPRTPRALPPPTPGGVTPLRDRGLPVHRLRGRAMPDIAS
ncbi:MULTISPECIES: hypothetical protein [Streptosporangiaceae]|uniref:hypothetical protein n=1 Tax=Streptosporangiaceae TaxID=2004 RepID=UPI0033EB22B3